MGGARQENRGGARRQHDRRRRAQRGEDRQVLDEGREEEAVRGGSREEKEARGTDQSKDRLSPAAGLEQRKGEKTELSPGGAERAGLGRNCLDPPSSTPTSASSQP